MKLKNIAAGIAVLGAVTLAPFGTAAAADVMCQTITNNHMLVDDAYVSTCIDAGVGNIGQGNQANDDWLNQKDINDNLIYTGYTTLGQNPLIGSFSQSGTEGTFSILASYWDDFANLYIGFKFGTGNQPDEWFVYQLQDGVTSGNWDFVNVFKKGGGLSHIALYGKGDKEPPEEIPEPGALGLLGMLALAAGVATRRRKA
ncbi:MAG: PEP-CTERM sorting domain-containing protein [Burkholderiales bacterium]|nr:PEP-CTERM sorting domain-containing protein [Burkholderiales bacterium]